MKTATAMNKIEILESVKARGYQAAAEKVLNMHGFTNVEWALWKNGYRAGIARTADGTELYVSAFRVHVYDPYTVSIYDMQTAREEEEVMIEIWDEMNATAAEEAEETENVAESTTDIEEAADEAATVDAPAAAIDIETMLDDLAQGLASELMDQGMSCEIVNNKIFFEADLGEEAADCVMTIEYTNATYVWSDEELNMITITAERPFTEETISRSVWDAEGEDYDTYEVCEEVVSEIVTWAKWEADQNAA